MSQKSYPRTSRSFRTAPKPRDSSNLPQKERFLTPKIVKKTSKIVTVSTIPETHKKSDPSHIASFLKNRPKIVKKIEIIEKISPKIVKKTKKYRQKAGPGPSVGEGPMPRKIRAKPIREFWPDRDRQPRADPSPRRKFRRISEKFGNFPKIYEKFEEFSKTPAIRPARAGGPVLRTSETRPNSGPLGPGQSRPSRTP